MNGFRKNEVAGDGIHYGRRVNQNQELLKAILAKNAAKVRQALAGGAEPNAPFGTSGTAALHYAAGTGIPELVQILLDTGANPNARDADQGTPLHWAATEGSLTSNEQDRLPSLSTCGGIKISTRACEPSLSVNLGRAVIAMYRWSKTSSAGAVAASLTFAASLLEIATRPPELISTGATLQQDDPPRKQNVTILILIQSVTRLTGLAILRVQDATAPNSSAHTARIVLATRVVLACARREMLASPFPQMVKGAVNNRAMCPATPIHRSREMPELVIAIRETAWDAPRPLTTRANAWPCDGRQFIQSSNLLGPATDWRPSGSDEGLSGIRH